MNLYCKFNIFAKVLRTLMEIGVFATAGMLLYNGEVSLTFFISMTYYIYRYMYMIDNLLDLNQTYQKVVVALKRINELVLNRKLQERRVFPAIDIMKSGTRRDDLLLTDKELEAATLVHKLVNDKNKEDSIENILDLFDRTNDNDEFILRVFNLE